MKKIAILLLVAIAFCSCARNPIFDNFIEEDREYTTYEIASILTGAPVEILEGIAFAESSGNQDAIGDDGISLGRFQINEKYHAYNAATYGEYNPMCPLDSAILTGRIYMADLQAMGSREAAIAAHNQGRAGVRLNGPDLKYVMKVLNYQLYKINV